MFWMKLDCLPLHVTQTNTLTYVCAFSVVDSYIFVLQYSVWMSNQIYFISSLQSTAATATYLFIMAYVSLIFATQHRTQWNGWMKIEDKQQQQQRKKKKKAHTVNGRNATSTWFHLHSWFWLLMLLAFSTKTKWNHNQTIARNVKMQKVIEKTTFGKHHAKIIKWRFACWKVVCVLFKSIYMRNEYNEPKVLFDVFLEFFFHFDIQHFLRWKQMIYIC